MFTNREQKLVKILYIVPEDEESAGEQESLWAYALGNHLYELQNIPFYSFELNVEDIVRCDESLFRKPIIRELIKPSGNKALRVVFNDETSDDICIDIMWELKQKNIFSEKIAHKKFMFNVPPNNNFLWARNYLKEKEDENLLWLYE